MRHLLALLLSVLAADACTSGCRCTARLTECAGVSSTRFLRSLSPGTARLRVVYSDIAVLGAGAFRRSGVQHLLVLKVEDCGVLTIDDGAFEGLAALRNLSLTRNKLERLTRAMLTGAPGLQELLLRKNRLKHVDGDAFRDLLRLRRLDLSQNRLAQLDERVFFGLGALRNLSIAHNSLDALHNQTFSRLTSLAALDFSYNTVSELPNELFRRVGGIASLKIFQNWIRVLEPDTFSSFLGLDHDRLELRVNKINVIRRDAFRGTPPITSLDLNGNALRAIEPHMFDHLPDLLELSLDWNRIAHIGAGAFQELPRLEVLTLGNNPDLVLPPDAPVLALPTLRELGLMTCGIRTVPTAAFKSLPRLKKLVLSYNDISQVSLAPFSKLPRLKTLKLHNNPLECDCGLRDLWRWCKHRRVRTSTLVMDPAGSAFEDEPVCRQGELGYRKISVTRALNCSSYKRPRSFKRFKYKPN